jgi:serine/threonine protein kinase
MVRIMALPRGWIRSDEFRETAGGQATILPVRRRDGTETFALKRLKNRDNPARVDRFRREVEAVVRLSEGGLSIVPRLIEVGLDDQRPYFIMPWYPAGSLQRAVDDKRYAGNPVQALRVAIRLGEAITQVHEYGAAHRDLKPDNIFLADAGIVLSDFGLCLDIADDSTRLTEPAEAIGSRLYIAPENESGINEDRDQRPADIYAYGKIVWALVAGRVPFSREAYRHPDWRLSSICGESKLDKLDGFFGMTLSADVRDRADVSWPALLSEVSAVVAALDGEEYVLPDRPQSVEIARAYANSDRVRDRVYRDEQFYAAVNWQHQHLMPAFTEALAIGPTALQDLQNESGNEFQFFAAHGWKPEHALADFFPDFMRSQAMAVPGRTLVGPRLTACTKAGDPELQIPTWSHATAEGAWLASIVIVTYRAVQNRPPWEPEPQLPMKVLHKWARLVGPLPVGMERSVRDARHFGTETAELFVGLGNRYVVRVANGDDLIFGDEAEWDPN